MTMGMAHRNWTRHSPMRNFTLFLLSHGNCSFKPALTHSIIPNWTWCKLLNGGSKRVVVATPRPLGSVSALERVSKGAQRHVCYFNYYIYIYIVYLIWLLWIGSFSLWRQRTLSSWKISLVLKKQTLAFRN